MDGLRIQCCSRAGERHHVHLRSRGKGWALCCDSSRQLCRRRAQTQSICSMLAERPLIVFLVEDAAERLGR